MSLLSAFTGSVPGVSWNAQPTGSVSGWWAQAAPSEKLSTRASQIRDARIRELLYPEARAALDRLQQNFLRQGFSPQQASRYGTGLAASKIAPAWDAALSAEQRANPIPLTPPVFLSNPTAYIDQWDRDNPGQLAPWYEASTAPVSQGSAQTWGGVARDFGAEPAFVLDYNLASNEGLKSGAVNREIPVGDYFASLFMNARLPRGLLAQLRRQAAPVDPTTLQNTPFSTLFASTTGEKGYEGTQT